MKGGGINGSIYNIAYYIHYLSGINRVGRKCIGGDRHSTVRGRDRMCIIYNMAHEEAD